MESKNMTIDRPKPSTIPDSEYDWAFDHYPDLVKKYPNQWIAFLRGKVLAHSKNPVLVLEKAKHLVKEKLEIPTLFIEKGIHIYFF